MILTSDSLLVAASPTLSIFIDKTGSPAQPSLHDAVLLMHGPGYGKMIFSPMSMISPF